MATTHSRTADDTAAIDHLHESFAAQRAGPGGSVAREGVLEAREGR